MWFMYVWMLLDGTCSVQLERMSVPLLVNVLLLHTGGIVAETYMSVKGQLSKT